jgi:hypothetical protein
MISLMVISCVTSDKKNDQQETPCGSLCDGLVAYYKLDGNGKDEIGAHNGTVFGSLTSVSNRNGEPEKAAYFGKDNYIQIQKLSLTGDISVFGWFLFKGDFHPNHQVFFGQAIDYSNRWQLIGSRNEITFYDRRGEDNSPYALNRNQDLGKWYSLSAVSSNSFPENKKVKLYLNGEVIGSVSSRSIEEIDAPYDIGRFYNESGWDYSDGNIDDVAIYNRQLTDEEVKILNDKGIEKYK